MTALDYKREAKRVLDYVTSGGNIGQLSQDEMRVLKHCYEKKYIEGIVVLEMISGRIVAEVQRTPTITLAGLEFYEQLSVDECKAQDNNKRPNTIKRIYNFFRPFVVKFWVLFLAVGAIVGFAVDWPEFIKMVFSLFHIP